ncbi:MAG: TM2 domain-containing protein [Caulobacterales bacterium]|uniref:TM2 domain-containing protein n=1 Tax=Glycocaulis sp. TaxID=1969725 RepID=UPI003F9ED58A
MNRFSYTNELFAIVGSLPEASRPGFLSAFQASEKNAVLLYGFNIWLGFLGIDRFLVGDIIAGILKLITLGGFGLWQLIDCFLIGGRARQKNIEYARQLRDSFANRAATPPAASPGVPAEPAS